MPRAPSGTSAAATDPPPPTAQPEPIRPAPLHPASQPCTIRPRTEARLRLTGTSMEAPATTMLTLLPTSRRRHPALRYVPPRHRPPALLLAGVALWACLPLGCQMFVDSADREVYSLIARRQEQALGIHADPHVGEEHVPIAVPETAYRTVPSRVDSAVPQEFDRPPTHAETSAEDFLGPAPKEAPKPPAEPDEPEPAGPEAPDSATEPTLPDEPPAPQPPAASSPAADQDQLAAAGPVAGAAQPASAPATPAEQPLVLDLAGCVAYAFDHARDFKQARESLYLAALDLTLERFRWTPQLAGRVGFEYANFGQIRKFADAMRVVTEFSASQRLPLGGEVIARILSTYDRDLNLHTDVAKGSVASLEATVPLLRNAGPIAYEALLQAERNLVYAIRDFERFRRVFYVDVASQYLQLVSLKQQIRNAELSVESFRQATEREAAFVEAERRIPLDYRRAKQSLLNAQNALLRAREAYEAALDRFKIRIGMPIEQPFDILEESGLLAEESDVTEEQAIRVALEQRLDLLNARDRVDDARRAVANARNNLLPDLNLSGSVTVVTDPDRQNFATFDADRTTWRGAVDLEIPLNRQAERNAYRAAIIELRRAERAYDLAEENVRADVRDALRRIRRERASVMIARENVEVGVARRDQAEELVRTGRLGNRDLVEAENDLLRARNDLADAIRGYRQAILAFRRDTGTLRVDDQGRWIRPFPPPWDMPPSPQPPSGDEPILMQEAAWHEDDTTATEGLQ